MVTHNVEVEAKAILEQLIKQVDKKKFAGRSESKMEMTVIRKDGKVE